jgi:hypothetical protein
MGQPFSPPGSREDLIFVEAKKVSVPIIPAGAQISVLGIRSPPTLTFTTLPALAR